MRFAVIACLSGDGSGGSKFDDFVGDSNRVVGMRRRRFLSGLTSSGEPRFAGLVTGMGSLDLPNV